MSLTERATHFEFGENWRNYAKTIDQKRIDAAIAGLIKLFPEGLAGKTVLDIGCGSGLHAFAALSLGAGFVTAIDIDENSVSTTRELLTRLAPGANWSANAVSIFDLSPEKIGTFDVVYSWGVLHHTGDMWRAIEKAAKLVKLDGLLSIAIYATTTCDNFWKAEKRLYSKAPRAAQSAIRLVYTGAYLTGKALSGVGPTSFLRSYSNLRGMNFSHDAHDWLGGYPYESSTADELHDQIASLGFSEVRSFRLPVTFGLFGAGCHEFVFRNCPEPR